MRLQPNHPESGKPRFAPCTLSGCCGDPQKGFEQGRDRALENSLRTAGSLSDWGLGAQGREERTRPGALAWGLGDGGATPDIGIGRRSWQPPRPPPTHKVSLGPLSRPLEAQSHGLSLGSWDILCVPLPTPLQAYLAWLSSGLPSLFQFKKAPSHWSLRTTGLTDGQTASGRGS